MKLILVGKQIPASIKRLMLYMGLIVTNLVLLKLKQKKTGKMTRSLEIWAILDLSKRLRKLNIGRRILLRHQIFLMINYQIIWTSETLVVMISQVTLEIKVIVVHATRFHSHKLWKQDWNWSMESSQKKSHRKCSWLATIWMKAVMVDGPTLMSFLLKMAMSFLKNVLHISRPQKVINVQIMKDVRQSPRFRDHIS